MVPRYLQELKSEKQNTGLCMLRIKNDFAETDCRKTKYHKPFLPFAVSLWNRLDKNRRKIQTMSPFGLNIVYWSIRRD